MVLDDRANVRLGHCSMGRRVAQRDELPAERFQGTKLAIHCCDLLVKQAPYVPVRLFALIAQLENLADLVEGQSDRLRLDHEAQALNVRLAVEAIARRRPSGRRQYADLFIVGPKLAKLPPAAM